MHTPPRLLLSTLAGLAVALTAVFVPGPVRAEQAEAATVTAEKSAKKKRSAKRRSRRDLDGDGIPNRRDRDIDGDRRPNKRDRDIDGDRVRNGRDRDIDGDRRRNGRDREMDSDRVSNKRDRDIDADRLRNCPRDKDMDADRIRNPRDRDMDGDGEPNATDKDIDADGVSNRRDPDMDCDGIPNWRDDDSDSDGIARGGKIPNVRLPRAFFGIVSDQAGSAAAGGERAWVLDHVGSTGVGLLRQKFEWSQVERVPGQYDFGFYDAYLADVTRAGFTVLPVLFDPPAFRSARPAVGAARGIYPPASNHDFGAYAAAAVRRYGPGGSFWSEHPELPYRPLRAWQVWNEPHIGFYWPTGPNPGAYTDMLRTVGAEIKAADPGAEVVAAALSESNLGMPMETYLKRMYAAGAASASDTLAIHPYAGAADESFDIMNRIREIADASGDGDAPLWVTELGWATGGPANPFNVGHEAQAELIKRVWATLVTERDRLKLRGLVYFNWRDQHPYEPPFQDFFGLHTGLLELDGSAKPSFSVFSRTVQAMIER